MDVFKILIFRNFIIDLINLKNIGMFVCTHLQTSNENLFCKVYEWRKETVKKICRIRWLNTVHEVSNLLECQMLCINAGWNDCIGINYSESDPTSCIICANDVFDISTVDNYFYRRVPLAGNIQ